MSINIIPKPLFIEYGDGSFNINAYTVITTESCLAGFPAEYLNTVIYNATGNQLVFMQMAGNSIGENVIEYAIDRSFAAESYSLDIKSTGVKIVAGDKSGFFYATQTLLQLMPPAVFSTSSLAISEMSLPCVFINDKPAYSWRGAMIDVARHFFPVSFIKKFIDLLALHKLNTLHLHLTDDQGWRIEIKKYPKLISVGSHRKETVISSSDVPDERKIFDGIPYIGFYTQDEVRDLVQYAGERGIEIVPEIDFPGHTMAAIASYPELGSTGKPIDVWTMWGFGKDILNPFPETLRFFEDVLTEVMDIFPSRFIHIGGDEVMKEIWRNNPDIQARMKELGLEDEDALQSYYIKHFDHFLDTHGRRLIGWDEILEGGLAESATVMSWRGEEGGIKAANAGHDVVMASNHHLYFDYPTDENEEKEWWMGITPLEKVYEFHPTPAEIAPDKQHHILGAQGQIWTEYIRTQKKLETRAFPRLCALAEIAWTPQADREYGDFQNRLSVHLQRLDAIGVHYWRQL